MCVLAVCQPTDALVGWPGVQLDPLGGADDGVPVDGAVVGTSLGATEAGGTDGVGESVGATLGLGDGSGVGIGLAVAVGAGVIRSRGGADPGDPVPMASVGRGESGAVDAPPEHAVTTSATPIAATICAPRLRPDTHPPFCQLPSPTALSRSGKARWSARSKYGQVCVPGP